MNGINIVICVKQVPLPEGVEIDPETGTLKREQTESEISPFDLNAVEEAIRIKEKHGGKITSVSMGPPKVEEILKETLAMGVDDALLLSDRAMAGADTLATSYTLGCAIRKMDFDLVICGEKTTDGDTGQVGPELAVRLGTPFVPYVQRIEEIKKDGMIVQRALENGYHKVEVPFPCLITVTKDINNPRLPTLRGKIEARKRSIPVWDAEKLEKGCNKLRFGISGSATRVVKIAPPPRLSRGEIINGEPREQARILVQKLVDMRFL